MLSPARTEKKAWKSAYCSILTAALSPASVPAAHPGHTTSIVGLAKFAEGWCKKFACKQARSGLACFSPSPPATCRRSMTSVKRSALTLTQMGQPQSL